MKKLNPAIRVWVSRLVLVILSSSSVYAQEGKDSINGKVHELDAVTVTARRMPAKISSATSVQVFRKEDLKNRLERSARLVSGEEAVQIKGTGEDGVRQIRALLGLGELVTNVNIPNRGQIPNLPIGAIVETNAVFRDNALEPIFAGNIPNEIYPMVSRICAEQEMISEGIAERDIEKIFQAFAGDPLVTCGLADARKLFDEMCENTKKYLKDYNI